MNRHLSRQSARRVCRLLVALLVALLTIVLTGCGSAIRGVRLSGTPLPDSPVATATTSEPGGVRVLALKGGVPPGEPALLASSSAELVALWSDMGLDGAPPAVDFSTHIVIATQFESGVYQDEVLGARIDRHGVLMLDEKRSNSFETMILALVRYAKVIAIPRRLVGTRLTWRVSDYRDSSAYVFSVPPPKGSPRPITALASPSLARPVIAAPLGTVELPAAGHLALRALADGRQVWVVHRTGGDISVVMADINAYFIDDGAIRHAVSWNAEFGRFDAADGRGEPMQRWDARGRSVDGGPPLETLSFARVDDHRIAIGDPAALPDGVIELRADAPVLDGDDAPYAAVEPSEFEAIPDGQVGWVAADLVHGIDGVFRLCRAREWPAPGCTSTAPARVSDRATRDTTKYAYVHVRYGPHAVRRRGSGFDLVVNFGNGLGDSLWDDGSPRVQPPAAPRGPARVRGALAVGQIVSGDTQGAPDSMTPACVAPELAGGADEVWTMTAPETADYRILLDTDQPGVLAVLGEDGRTLACSRSAHHGKNKTGLLLSLAAGQRIRVVVDVVYTRSQRYQLRAVVAPPRRLVLGETITGSAVETTAEPALCGLSSVAYRLTIEEAGAYVFSSTGTPWAPRFVVLPDGEPRACRARYRLGQSTEQLAPGNYTVVIGELSASWDGEYTMRVDPAPAP